MPAPCSRRSSAPISATRIGCISSSRSARRSRTRGRTRAPSLITPRGNAQHRRHHPYSADENGRFVSRSKREFTAEFFSAREAAGALRPSAVPDIHRGPAARRLDLDRADPRQSLPGGGDDGAARYSMIARELIGRDELPTETRTSERRMRTRRARARFFEALAALDAAAAAPSWASAILPRPACIASAARPTSSTRCRTISSTSA